MNVKRFASALLAGVIVAVPVVSSGLQAAYAHDVVIRSNPADGGTVQHAPTQLELEFSGIPKDTFNTVALSNQDTGKVLFSADPVLQGQIIKVDIPADVKLNPGSYKIGFQITSSDGHATRGMTTFKLAGEGAALTAEPEDMVASSSEAPYSNETFLYFLIAGLVGLVAIVVGIVLVLSQRKKRS